MSATILIWLIYAFWLIFIAYLIVSARRAKSDTQGHSLQSFGLLFAIIAAFLLPYLPIFHFVNFAPVNPVLSSIGLILSVAGVTFLVWARQRLGRNWSQTVSVKEGHELVTSGPDRCIRHPMYTGGFIACLVNEVAYESPAHRHGLLTLSLIRTLQGGEEQSIDLVAAMATQHPRRRRFFEVLMHRLPARASATHHDPVPQDIGIVPGPGLRCSAEPILRSPNTTSSTTNPKYLRSFLLIFS